jgi:hypothetical protein
MAAGLALGLQGWRNRLYDIDFFPDMENAINLVQKGQIPARGNLSSFGSYNPPGPSCLWVPGVLLTNEPRLFPVPGSALIYVATLIGVFLLARDFFGTPCACLATAAYGLSGLGLAIASSPWQRHPMQAFVVWTVYGACRWARHQDAKALVLALAAWAGGTYVFMEMAPALFILPVLWVVYRPLVRAWALLAGAAVFLLIWFPYLRYEASRDFIDLRSLIGQVDISPRDFKASWCDPSLEPRPRGARSASAAGRSEPSEQPRTGTRQALYQAFRPAMERGIGAVNNLVEGFDPNAPFPGTNLLFLLLTIAGVVLLGVRPKTLATARPDPPPVRPRRFRRPLDLAGAAMILLAAATNELVITRFISPSGVLDHTQTAVARALPIMLILGGVAILLRGPIARAVRVVASQTADARPLVLSLLVPWLLTAVVAEPGRGDRFWWFWPIQVVILAAVATVIPRHLGLPRLVSWVGATLLIIGVWGNPLAWAHWTAWRSEGWSGADDELIHVVDDVAAQIRADGKDHAAIGYQIFFQGGEAYYYAIDPRYKVGVHLDFLFQWKHKITKDDRCPEGASLRDEYRIIDPQTTIEAPEGAVPGEPQRSFRLPLPADFKPFRQYQNYQVFRRR